MWKKASPTSSSSCCATLQVQKNIKTVIRIWQFYKKLVRSQLSTSNGFSKLMINSVSFVIKYCNIDYKNANKNTHMGAMEISSHKINLKGQSLRPFRIKYIYIYIYCISSLCQIKRKMGWKSLLTTLQMWIIKPTSQFFYLVCLYIFKLGFIS